MASKKSSKKAKDVPFRQVVARNRKARHDFLIEEEFEAGIQLLGSEVKSLRGGKASLQQSYARLSSAGELWLVGTNIPEYPWANRLNHEPTRERKLLLHASELNRLKVKTRERGFTLIPLEIYFNARGKVKVRIGLGRGKRLYDKRAALRKSDHDREIERAYKGED